MFTVNDDLSIYLTRGDTLFFNVRANDHGYPYTFKPGDIVRISVTAKKDVTNVYIQKDFPVYEASRTVFVYLEGWETKIGEKISKYRDYWYEIVLNPDTVPQTIIGNNDDGAKILRLFPEADDVEDEEILPEEIPAVDAELDLVSDRPVSNRAVSAAIARLTAAIEQLKGNMPNLEEPDGSVFNAIGQVEGLAFLSIDAYGVAVKNGFEGTEEEWLASLEANPERIKQFVNEYMEANPISVDTTLTKEGWAADAKATSDAIENAVNNHANNRDNPHRVTKEQVGLGSVNNTADIDKPVSNAQAAAIAEAKKAGADAQTAAENAQTAAENAQTAAENAQTAAENAGNNALMKSGGTMSGDIDMNGKRIVNLPSPTEDSDIITKLYMETYITDTFFGGAW